LWNQAGKKKEKGSGKKGGGATSGQQFYEGVFQNLSIL
jgi:hypothetical protein